MNKLQATAAFECERSCGTVIPEGGDCWFDGTRMLCACCAGFPNFEHDDPVKWCRAPLCRHTNWGGYNRLHLRGSDCPPYDPNPEPNHMAEFWEAIREMARGTRP